MKRIYRIGLALLFGGALVGGALMYQHHAFRTGGTDAGYGGGWAALYGYPAAAILVTLTLPLRSPLTGGLVTAGLTFALNAVDAVLTTQWDQQYGGAYGWASERIAMMIWLGGPMIAGVAGVAGMIACDLRDRLLRRRSTPAKP